ncbi:MAG: proline--tRNA ligase [Gammaproteobacteria bacterium]|jgi:prolyl-tRNA synthetase|nr:proline--tRNA ligase [Gammaproteobacteria bacterium]MBT7603075.1 proline--tRNA ligase [Gammaproteobacteria bacterium]
MKYSKFGIITTKNIPNDAEVISHKLMLRTGMIKKLASGLYTWMPLGFRVLKKIENIIRQEMEHVNALEILMPAIQPSELWKESGRWDKYGPELLRLIDRHEREFCFGPTHEEIITDIARKDIKSYKQLPIIYYQIQTKFRDEIRPRFGVMRAREFLMKDAYSFHENEDCLNKTYEIMFQAYMSCFNKIGLEYKVVNANNGQIGGSESHEFHVIAENGEDELIFSDSSDYAINSELFTEPPKEGDDSPDGAGKVKIRRGIEVGHIFKLGNNYSNSMKASISNIDNKNINMVMGCYGIGVSRIAAAAIEQSNDDKGIIWPKSISPFDISIISIGYSKNEKIKKYTDDLYEILKNKGVDVLMDDRDISPGNMFSDSDLIGIPFKIIIGKQFLEKHTIEFKERIHNKTHVIQEDPTTPSKKTINNILKLIQN